MSCCDVLGGRTLKVTYQGDTRRTKVKLPDGATFAQAFSAIQTAVLAVFTLPPSAAAKLRLQYADDEDDLCTLNHVTIEDMASLCPTGALKLTFSLEEPVLPSAVAEQTPVCAAHEVQCSAQALAPPPDANSVPTPFCVMRPVPEITPRRAETQNAATAHAQPPEDEVTDGNMSVDTAEPDGEPTQPSEQADEAEVRELLNSLSQELNPGVRDLVKSVLLTMDPNIIKGGAGAVLGGYIRKDGEALPDTTWVRISKIVQRIDQPTYHRIVNDAFGSPGSRSSGSDSPTGDLMQNVLGALLPGGVVRRGSGGGQGSRLPNPLEGVLRAVGEQGYGQASASGGPQQLNLPDVLGQAISGLAGGQGQGGYGNVGPVAGAASPGAASGSATITVPRRRQ